MLQGNFKAQNTLKKYEKKYQINNVSYHLKNPEKEEQNNPGSAR